MKFKKQTQSGRSTKKKKGSIKLTSFADHLDQQYGKHGSARREKFEAEFEVFRLGALLEELRQLKGMTQTDIATRCGTTRHYISRIENGASDIRLSTLMRIIREGFGAEIKLSIAWN